MHEPPVGVAAAVDAVDDDEPGVAEQAAGVAVRGGVGAGDLLRGDELDGLGLEMAAEARERGLDLRPVAAGEQVDRLELRRLGLLGCSVAGHDTQRSVRTLIAKRQTSAQPVIVE